MLKIKDNVDLKELEKFGFKCFNEEKQFYDIKLCERYDTEEINIYNREINISLDGWETNNLDLLYDLIKDDLVEKVNE
jgi:hypothetical protein